jgi:hypothetical protein
VAELLILRFDGVGEKEYAAVNAALGTDSSDPGSDWPPGILWHGAGTADDGSFVVSEVWESREAQAAFMESRLGAALGAGGVTSAPTVTWVPLLASTVVDRG